MKKVIGALIVLVILVVAIVLVASNKKDNQSSSGQTGASSTSSSSQSNASASAAQSQNVITFSNNGFSPNSLTVKSGDSITLKNDSSQPVQFRSNPHPVHTDDPELNQNSLDPGQSLTFKVTSKGTFGYHNHLDPNQTGRITIQ